MIQERGLFLFDAAYLEAGVVGNEGQHKSADTQRKHLRKRKKEVTTDTSTSMSTVAKQLVIQQRVQKPKQPRRPSPDGSSASRGSSAVPHLREPAALHTPELCEEPVMQLSGSRNEDEGHNLRKKSKKPKNAQPKVTTEEVVPDTAALRRKAKVLFKSAISDADASFGFTDEACECVAVGIESEIYRLHGHPLRESDWQRNYRSKCRSLAFNLSKHGNLILQLLLEELTPAELCAMDKDELATDEMLSDRKRLREQALYDATASSMDRGWIETVDYQCGNCKSTDTKYWIFGDNNMSRKAEVWGNADRDNDPIAKITCKACGHEWDKVLSH